MIAFSDPNDVMSYPLPEPGSMPMSTRASVPGLPTSPSTSHLSRSLLGLGEVAHPLTADSGYSGDERVGGLLAKGAGHGDTADIVQDRCTWFATDESLMY